MRAIFWMKASFAPGRHQWRHPRQGLHGARMLVHHVVEVVASAV